MIITRTPFRISFFGGGSDYPAWYKSNGGAVISTTIDKYCYIACRLLPPFFEHKSRIVWSKIESVKNTDEIEHPSVRACLNFCDFAEIGMEIHHNADLPARSGLGSSSSFTVGMLHALHALQGKMITKRQLALNAIHVEQEILKENVGSQDQVAAAFGGLNRIEFGGPQHITVTPVILNPERLKNFENHLMLFFTGISRNASEIAAEQIKNTESQSKDNEIKTMKNMVDEAVNILHNGSSPDDFGRLLNESWKLKRTLSSLISNQTIDNIYEAGLSAGALGGKLLGAGGGGFILFFVKPEKQPNVREALKNLLHVPILIEHLGSQVVYYAPEITRKS